MDLIKRLAQILLGLIFVVFGLNGFFHFMSMPQMSQPGVELMMALGKTGYFFTLLKLCEIIGGMLVLTGMSIPLGLLILAPITVNIFMFHLFLAPGGLLLGSMVLMLELVMIYLHRDIFMRLMDK